MVETLKILTAASKLVIELRRLTNVLPPEEDFMLVPVMRDEVLGILENIALGSAGFNPVDRYRFLMAAKHYIDSLHSRIVLCRATGLFTKSDCSLLESRQEILKGYLIENIHRLKDDILDPSNPW
jgi:hypothetical protein